MSENAIAITVLDPDFTVLRADDTDASAKDSLFQLFQIEFQSRKNSSSLLSLTKTGDSEISLVLPFNLDDANLTLQPNIQIETGWRAFRVAGKLEFSLVGILAKISNILAGISVSLFVISTFDTDFILVKKESLEKSVAELSRHGIKST